MRIVYQIMDVKVQPLEEQEIGQIVEIASACFGGMRDREKARDWVFCNFRAFPRMKYFVAREADSIIGYILWMEKGGFRESSVVELEQIAVKEDCRGNGVGSELVRKSLRHIQADMKKRGSKLKLIEVTTGTDNQAQSFYRKNLNAEPECIIRDLFKGDEVVMISRMA